MTSYRTEDYTSIQTNKVNKNIKPGWLQISTRHHKITKSQSIDYYSKLITGITQHQNMCTEKNNQI